MNMHRRAVEEQIRGGRGWNREIHLGITKDKKELRFYRVVNAGVILHTKAGDKTTAQIWDEFDNELYGDDDHVDQTEPS